MTGDSRGREAAVHAAAGTEKDMQRLMDLKVERLVSWLKDDAPRGPVMLELVLSNACNLRCVFCWKRRLTDDRILDCDRAIGLVREAARLGVRWVRLAGGGEPLLDPSAALAVMREVKLHGMFGTLITNATMLERGHISDIVAMGWDEILVSLDGATPGTNDALRGKRGAFRRCVLALRGFMEEKRLQHAGRPVMRLQFVATNRNYHELPAYVALAERLGVSAITVLPLKELNPLVARYRLVGRRLLESDVALASAARKAEHAGILFQPPAGSAQDMPFKAAAGALLATGATGGPSVQSAGPVRRHSALVCYEPFLSLTVQADGSLGPCCHWYGRRFCTLGRASLTDAWRSKEFQGLRELFMSSRLHEYCEGCLACDAEGMDVLRSGLAASWGDRLLWQAAMPQRVREEPGTEQPPPLRKI